MTDLPTPSAPRLAVLGTGVMGGMITATVLAVFFVPVFFVVVMRLFRRKQVAAEETAPARAERAAPAGGVPAE